MLPADLRRIFEPPADLLRDDPPDHWDIGYSSGKPEEVCEDAWGIVWQEADRRGLIRKDQIGQPACALLQI